MELIRVSWTVTRDGLQHYVQTNIDGRNYGERIELHEPGAPLDRAVRNAVVGAFEYALSERMGLWRGEP